ncbi:MAG: hypothetical protein COA67_09160 [Lutibacter sp.]|nr:MAG: hypothetical protein COA67_09160 [Lutibacter sp.]
MKKIIIIMAVLTLTACKNNKENQTPATEINQSSIDESNSNDFPVMTFEEREHDFGTIRQGDKVSTFFKFTNTGNAPLLISDIKAKCGCTVPDWTKETIAPGDSGMFKVDFNSRGKKNRIRQVITIDANTKSVTEKVTIVAVIKV